MHPTTILVNEKPKCVVRPLDTKDLNRFLRNGRSYLLARDADGKISHRIASDAERARWTDAFALHRAWGGEDEAFFGVPLDEGPSVLAEGCAVE